VQGISVGDRVGYFSVVGAYAEARNVPAERLVKLPSGIADRTAAAILIKGVTAQYLCRQAYPVSSGQTVLIHAAAGGVGLILSQWAKSLGAIVIGTVGSEEKAAIARAHGCAHTIVYTNEDFVARVNEFTGGRKCDVVFDALGKDTAAKSLDCLRPRGTLVCFGRTTGWPSAMEPSVLMLKGSLVVTMTQLRDFASTRQDIDAATADLFAAIMDGSIEPVIHQQYALEDAQQAHRDLESRRTIGSSVLTV
jgi:NADPH:quinone reductase